jgi:hypothetical protein
MSILGTTLPYTSQSKLMKFCLVPTLANDVVYASLHQNLPARELFASTSKAATV